MQDLMLSICQADLHWEQIDANLAMFEEQIWQIEADTDLILLPEMFSTGFTMNAAQLAEPPGGKTFKWMKMMAAQKSAAIMGSYVIKEQDEFYNRAYFVYPDGSSVFYDKKHLFSLAKEDEAYHPGKERVIVEYKGWRILPLICYDLRFPVWSRSNSSEKNLYEYDLVAYVANWPSPRVLAWDTLLKARAIENIAYAAGVNRTGVDGYEKEYPGHSAIFNFKGEEMVFSEKMDVMTCSLSYEKLIAFRERYPFQKDADSFSID